MRQRWDGGNQSRKNEQCRERPRNRRPAEKRNELPPPHGPSPRPSSTGLSIQVTAVHRSKSGPLVSEFGQPLPTWPKRLDDWSAPLGPDMLPIASPNCREVPRGDIALLAGEIAVMVCQ